MAKGGFRGGMGGGNMMKQAQKMQEEFMRARSSRPRSAAAQSRRP